MTFGNVFESYAKQTPICVMTRAALENIFSSDRLDSIFEEHSQRQHTNELLFSSIADMMAAVVCRIYPSVNAAYKSRTKELGVSVNAVYDKLQGIEPQVSRQVVRETADHAKSIIEKTKGALSRPLAGYRVKIVDGNHFRRTDRRIGELRGANVAPLPGKALAILDPQLRLVIDVIPCEDGHANERKLFGALSETIQQQDVWIGDRNFCTTNFLFSFFSKHAYFVIRQHGRALNWELKGRRTKKGATETGIVYEQAMQILDNEDNCRVIRRVTVKLHEPTRDGETEIHILTNLPKKVGSLRIAQLYSDRWTIETAFQELAENLDGEINTLGYPKAALFAFSLALVAYNILSVVRAAMRATHGADETENMSTYYMADEIAGTYRGMMVVLPSRFWTKQFANLTASRMAKALLHIAKNTSPNDYRKNKWSPKKKKKKQGKLTRRKHVSTAQILEKRKTKARAA